MASPGQILFRTLFWSYERGSWQYDVAVILILVFVLLTPRRWFKDEPQVVLPGNNDQVKLLSKSGEVEIYQVDSRTMAPPERTPALQNELHTVLQKSLPTLSDGRFAISSIEAQRDDKGNVVAYQVIVRH
jgi:hypothetical protein